jgi:uncharacterized membrane protein
LRSLPALFGVSAIAAVYWLNRIAFSPKAGLLGAAIMAVSPFGIYLSQEARHYTLPTLLITLALVGLIKIQQDLYHYLPPRLLVWLGWGIVNSIGGYVHYFFFLAFIAQIITLIVLVYWQRGKEFYHEFAITAILTITSVCLSYLPCIAILKEHFERPESDWLPPPYNIAPLYQAAIGLLSMVIALPVERRPFWIVIPAAILMLFFGYWFGWQMFRRVRKLWRTPVTQITTLTLSSFSICVLLEFWIIVYLLNKDITVVFRYHFVYFSAICALVGASLVIKVKDNLSSASSKEKNRSLQKLNLQNYSFSFFLFTGSLLSSILVIFNLTFQKPYQPDEVAQHIYRQSSIPSIVVVGYYNTQDIPLGFSFALALDKIRNQNFRGVDVAADMFFAFLPKTLYPESILQSLSHISSPVVPPLNLWIIDRKVAPKEYPTQVLLANKTTCILDPTQDFPGITHILYLCQLPLTTDN